MYKFISMVLIGCLLAGVGLQAADSREEKAPDPAKALRKLSKDFLRLSSKNGYSAHLVIAGGMANSSDHQIIDQAVSEDYFGLVRGPLMHMPEQKIFRTLDKGAQFDGDIWRVLQSTADGKKLDRLFTFPERLLAEASLKSHKIEWLESTVKPRKVKREAPRGRTAVGSSEAEEKVYHRLRVTLPEKMALQYFIEVQNSGCLSGG
ncbi:MAG: hypothetical protein OSB09_05325 [Planctomycetota bacterium]|nr:hypothetical protein [Planctomycetota bacterium]